MRTKLARRIWDALVEDGTDFVSWGDGILVDACSGHTTLWLLQFEPWRGLQISLRSKD